MKRIGYILVGILLLSGCQSNTSSDNTYINNCSTAPLHMMPTHTPKPTQTKEDTQPPFTIPLIFSPLALHMLEEQQDNVDESHTIASIPFGYLKYKQLTLHILKSNTKDNTNRLDGLLELENRLYRISDISSDFSREGIENDKRCNEVCIYQTSFTEQERYEVIGSIELFANGPGLKRFIVYDKRENSLKYFDAWGKGLFVDLEHDKSAEFAIQFEGLHQSLPDVRIVDFIDDKLQISYPVYETIDKQMGDYAVLQVNEGSQPFIKLGNVFYESSDDGGENQANEVLYYYSNGELLLIQ